MKVEELLGIVKLADLDWLLGGQLYSAFPFSKVSLMKQPSTKNRLSFCGYRKRVNLKKPNTW
jgi:hypothetical protein